jgi:hypothetical protein
MNALPALWTAATRIPGRRNGAGTICVCGLHIRAVQPVRSKADTHPVPARQMPLNVGAAPYRAESGRRQYGNSNGGIPR